MGFDPEILAIAAAASDFSRLAGANAAVGRTIRIRIPARFTVRTFLEPLRPADIAAAQGVKTVEWFDIDDVPDTLGVD